MEQYEIRYATVEDIPAIMRFIDENWRKGHRLSKDRELFEWQYVSNGKVNMVVGVDAESMIYGILGFIPYSCRDNKDFSLALWKAKSGTAFLGVKLLMFLLKEEPHRHMFCNGINMDTTGGIYHRLGFVTGRMNQWYRLQEVQEYVIAKVVEHTSCPVSRRDDIELVKMNSFEELINATDGAFFNSSTVPFKSKEYLNRRYFEHPEYKYEVYGVQSGFGKINAAVVFRIQTYESSRALRIVDFIGDYDMFYLITEQLDDLARQNHAEYIDIYEKGLDADKMREAGWLKVGEDQNVIPNYFAPFLQQNIDINISTTDENIILFRGDGDQDRPN